MGGSGKGGGSCNLFVVLCTRLLLSYVVVSLEK